MQLHACLLLFIITTDKTLALSHHYCGGNLSLDQKPSGYISLALPGLYPDTPGLNHTDQNRSLCTWLIDTSLGSTILLKVVKLEGGQRISVRCVRTEEDQHLVLESGGSALLSGCDRNKATLVWTGTRHSSNEIQLSYYVQEDERNSSEVHTTHHPGQDLISLSQTSFTRAAPVSQEVVTRKEGGRGRFSEDLEQSQSPQSGLSSQDQGLLHPTSPLQGLTAAGRADRITLPLPEEGPNNGADTSGAAHLTDSPVSSTEGTRLYFHTQPTFSTDASNTAVGETNSSNKLTRAQMVSTDASASSSDTEKHKHTVAHTQAHPTVSSFSVPHLTSSHSDLSSQATRDGSALTSTVTSDPLKSPTDPPQDHSSSAHTSTQGPGRTPPAHVTELHTAHSSFHPNISQTDSFESTTSDAVSPTAPFQSSDQFDSTPTASSQSRTNSPYTSASLAQTSEEMQTATQSTQRYLVNAYMTTDTVSSSPGVIEVDSQTSSWSFTQGAALTLGDVVHNSAETGTTAQTPSDTRLHENQSTKSQTPLSPLVSAASIPTSTPSYMLHTEASSRPPHTPHKTIPSQTSSTKSTSSHTRLTQTPYSSSTTHISQLSLTTIKSDPAGSRETDVVDGSWRRLPSTTATPTPPSWPTPHPRQESHLTSSASTSWSFTSSQAPRFYIVPDQPAAVKVESVELLLQIILEDSRSASEARLEEDTAAWVGPYLQKAPGFSRLLGVWSSGHAVQSLVEFHTDGALQWLSGTGSTSLLERTGLAQAVREARSFRSSKITNITVGGLQGDVCDWLLQCPSGYRCVSQLGSANYSCSSVCRFDYCHHHGICTHHPGQPPVCRCLVGEDFWYMGQRCDVKMTRTRLIGACLAILLIIVTVIGILAFVAVRRYRAVLIQAKVDQTRSSYRRFNHFDELSGRFWLRSWAGSADSLDNPAFTRSDELLHLRALDRPCCYHDDTLSLASTCPSHGTRINTIYPHSSQYGWRGSEMSLGDGVLDSGKASDLSVCSWPVEPIQWTPFPLLQQLASHRTRAVRMSRPRSYCEGMELVDLEKSWTA